MRDKLTDRLVRSAGAPPDRPSRFIWDTEVTGFGLCVTKAGAKAFVVRYRIDGRERRLTRLCPESFALFIRRRLRWLKFDP